MRGSASVLCGLRAPSCCPALGLLSGQGGHGVCVCWLLCPGQLAGCRARLPRALGGRGPCHGPELCSCIFASFTSAPDLEQAALC